MNSSFLKLMSILSLTIAISLPLSMCHSLKYIKPDKPTVIATIKGVIALAIEESEDIRGELDQWFANSTDDKLKNKYHLCSENYKNAEHYLGKVCRKLDTDHYRKVLDDLSHADDELDKCRREFESESLDPAHVGDKNEEFGEYLDTIRATLRYLDDTKIAT